MATHTPQSENQAAKTAAPSGKFFGDGGSAAPFFQAKLTVNTPGDAHEREADSVADQVMRMKTGDAPIVQRMPITPVSGLQRACSHCDQEKQKEEDVMRKETGGGDASGKAAPSIVSEVLSSSGQPMESGTRQFMESRFGQDFSQVRIHTDNRAGESAKAIQARAYTSGRDVVFGNGEYQPGSETGQRLLAHELVHTIQQNMNHERIQKQDAECAGYGTNEVVKSRSEEGILENDIILEPGKIIIADFGVDWRHIKEIAKKNPTLRAWLQTFDQNTSYRLNITGYSDCVGAEHNNTYLRHQRAKRIEEILSDSTKSRVTFRGMAALGQYIAPNMTPEGRAKNRSVVISFSQSFDFEPENLEVDRPKYCGPDFTIGLKTEMDINRKHPLVVACGDLVNSNKRFIPVWGQGALAGCLKGFEEMVKAGAEWDLKSNHRQWRHSVGRHCPSEVCDKTVTLCGHCLNYDVPGNIHFGYIGRMMGIRNWLLHLGAARAQQGGVDDPKDTVAINIGINMADNGATLCGEINAKLSQLNQDNTRLCSPCPWSSFNPANRYP